jgi:hypothetical protein
MSVANSFYLYSSKMASQSRIENAVLDKVLFVAKGRADYKHEGNQVIFEAKENADVGSSTLTVVADKFAYLQNTLVQMQEKLKMLEQLGVISNMLGKMDNRFDDIDETLQEVQKTLKFFF